MGDAKEPRAHATGAPDLACACCGHRRDWLVRHWLSGSEDDAFCRSCWDEFLETYPYDGIWTDTQEQYEITLD